MKEFKIRLIESNVEELTKCVTKAKQKLEMSENNLFKTKSNQNECKERKVKLMAKIKDAKQYLIHKKSSIIKMIESKDKYDLMIKELVQQRVQQLTTYIFPIEAKEAIDESTDKSCLFSSETTPLLEPISDSNNFNVNYIIVEPWINGNGDYSAFALFGK